MTRLSPHRVQPSDIPPVVLQLGRTRDILGHACPCPKDDCATIGQHVLRATRNATPGLKAQNLDTSTRGSNGDVLPFPDMDERPDPTTSDHALLQRAIAESHNWLQVVEDLVQQYRPDRSIPKEGDRTSDADWCRTCLAHRKFAPRYRGDQCSWCWSFTRSYKVPPPAALIAAHHEGHRVTQQMIVAALKRPKKRKRKAS